MSEKTLDYHIPVLLKESVEGLAIKPDGTYIDATFGGGGHSRAILQQLQGGGRLYGFDQDADAERNIPSGDGRFTFVRSNFRYLANFMRYAGVTAVDGILADLGVSSHHFDEPERGFSFRFDDSPLDMRMNGRAGQTAADVLNNYSEEALADLFRRYGELKQARRLAAAIVRRRATQPIGTAAELTTLASATIGSKEADKKTLAQLFQALRIEVNDEMSALQALLMQAERLLVPGGRMAVITYHSLEDRPVKNFFRTGRIDGEAEADLYGNRPTPFKLLNNRVVTPSNAELQANPRSRSAKLRIAVKQ